MPATLRLILGDQLNPNHSWFQEINEDVTYLMMEVRSETNYVRHHIQKVTGFFVAMRAFSKVLENEGHRVVYLKLDDKNNASTISENVKRLIQEKGFGRFEYQLPDEYRLDRELAALKGELAIPVEAVDTEHFLSDRKAVERLFEGKKTYLLETFYRHMRRRYHILMEEDGDNPLTGRWNYDQENRKKLPEDLPIPEKLSFRRDVSDIVAMIREAGVQTIGRIDPETFDWPITREESLELLHHFAQVRLMYFGAYQDAMTDRDWLLFHSRLSFAMNTKMLHPLEVVNTCLDYWKRSDDIGMAQIEGFVRQIIGWREFMRGIYWAKMPDYASLNYFGHEADLPDFFWTGDTRMKCLNHAINQSLDHAYAHHIQRLMVTGNFALLLGVEPSQVDAWYLGIYMDAIEWVELTNTRGMSQFADGGIVGTKPYVASANYMHKMGDYCGKCPYDRKAKVGEKACPFNSLYWDFYERHRDKLGNNFRVGMMYRTWDRRDEDEKEQILERAAFVKEHIEEL